jgi:hypothetical protein
MKSSVNSIIIVLIALGILFAFSPIITTNLSLIAGNSDNNLYDINLAPSKILIRLILS